MKNKPSKSRRNVFLDVETVSLDPNDSTGALSGLTRQVVCICLLIDDGKQIIEHPLIDRDLALEQPPLELSHDGYDLQIRFEI